MATILGINAFHGDAAACLVRDGQLVAAAEEERFRRIKHWAGFPERGDPLLPGGRRHRPGRRRSRGAEPGLEGQPRQEDRVHAGQATRPRPWCWIASATSASAPASRRTWDALSRAERFAARVHAVEHHVAHLSSAFHVSPFDEAAVVSVDGFGDFASAAWGAGSGTQIDVEDRVYFPHSLGIFYQALTQFLGFPAVRRRVQGDGARPLRRADASCDAMRQIVLLQGDGSFRARPRLLPAPSREDRLRVGGRRAGRRERSSSPALETLLGPAREQGRAARAAPPRHRALGAGDVRGGVLPSARRAPRAAPGRPRSPSPAAAR